MTTLYIIYYDRIINKNEYTRKLLKVVWLDKNIRKRKQMKEY